MRTIKTTCFAFFLALIDHHVCAQQISMSEISGQLSNLKSDQLGGISVNLIEAQTKKVVKVKFPDTAGKFISNQIEQGNYQVPIKSLAFKNYESNLIVLTHNYNRFNTQI